MKTISDWVFQPGRCRGALPPLQELGLRGREVTIPVGEGGGALGGWMLEPEETTRSLGGTGEGEIAPAPVYLHFGVHKMLCTKMLAYLYLVYVYFCVPLLWCT